MDFEPEVAHRIVVPMGIALSDEAVLDNSTVVKYPPPDEVTNRIDLAHRFKVTVSAAGFVAD